MIELAERPWWNYLEHDLKELLTQSQILLKIAANWESQLSEGREKFHDYSFVVFPAAKAYEGFLKKLFLDMGFITINDFRGKRFRIGKALNPTLYRSEMKKHNRYKRLRKKISVYDKLTEYCGGEDLGQTMWNTWKECRNLLFHWFPKEKNAISFDESEEKLRRIVDTMDMTFRECKIN